MLSRRNYCLNIVYQYFPPPKKLESLTPASLSGVKLITRIASTTVTANVVNTYMITTSVANFTLITIYALASTSTALTPTVSRGRIVTVAISGFVSI